MIALARDWPRRAIVETHWKPDENLRPGLGRARCGARADVAGDHCCPSGGGAQSAKRRPAPERSRRPSGRFAPHGRIGASMAANQAAGAAAIATTNRQWWLMCVASGLLRGSRRAVFLARAQKTSPAAAGPAAGIQPRLTSRTPSAHRRRCFSPIRVIASSLPAAAELDSGAWWMRIHLRRLARPHCRRRSRSRLAPGDRPNAGLQSAPPFWASPRGAS